MQVRSLAPLLLCTTTACVSEVDPLPAPDILLQQPAGPLTVALPTRLDPARDLAWCASAALAWQALQTFLGGPVQLDTRPPLVDFLNAADVRGIDPSSFYAIAGITDEVGHVAVAAALRERFGRADERLAQAFADAGAGQVFTYAFLFEELRWRVPFVAASEPLAFRWRDAGQDKRENVAAFGLRDFDYDSLQQHQELTKQVRIWEGSGDTFAVELSSDLEPERILLARIAPGATLAETLAAALALRSGQASRLRKGDDLIVPIIDLDETRAFGEIAGRFEHAGFEERGLAGAWQAVRFRLDRKGARLESSFWAAGAESKAPPEPRRLVFDQPFLVALLTDDTPLFAAWIATPTFLTAHQ